MNRSTIGGIGLAESGHSAFQLFSGGDFVCFHPCFVAVFVENGISVGVQCEDFVLGYDLIDIGYGGYLFYLVGLFGLVFENLLFPVFVFDLIRIPELIAHVFTGQ